MLKINHTEICECKCHRKDKSIIHVMPCCPLTYCKYINKDGKIDYVKWAKANMKKI